MKEVEYRLKILRAWLVRDRIYLSRKFMKSLGYCPDLDTPKSFNEKVNYRMLYDNNPLYTSLSDKLAVRQFVTQHIGEEYVVPLLAILVKVNHLNLTKLPERFVLKCSHDSGSSVICKDKSRFNISQAKKTLAFHLNRNLYYVTRERHYKPIPARILCEAYIDIRGERPGAYVAEVFRVHCFSGSPVYVEVEFTDAFGGRYSNLYDIHWQRQDVTFETPNLLDDVAEPVLFQEMLWLAQRLVAPFDYCRADFLLSSENKLYFSELTFTPNAGRMVMNPRCWDFKLGALWTQAITP